MGTRCKLPFAYVCIFKSPFMRTESNNISSCHHDKSDDYAYELEKYITISKQLSVTNNLSNT